MDVFERSRADNDHHPRRPPQGPTRGREQTQFAAQREHRTESCVYFTPRNRAGSRAFTSGSVKTL